MVAVDAGFPARPRTDPGVRHFRTGLLLQVITPKRTTDTGDRSVELDVQVLGAGGCEG